MHAANKPLRSVFLLQATAFDTSVQGFFNKWGYLLLVFLQFRIYLSESEPARDFTCLRSSRLPTLSKIVASRVKNATSLTSSSIPYNPALAFLFSQNLRTRLLLKMVSPSKTSKRKHEHNAPISPPPLRRKVQSTTTRADIHPQNANDKVLISW